MCGFRFSVHTGGKNRRGSISKQGDRYLRSLFMAGALAVILYAKINGTKHRPWLTALLARRPTKVAAIALANKIARMVWAITASRHVSIADFHTSYHAMARAIDNDLPPNVAAVVIIRVWAVPVSRRTTVLCAGQRMSHGG
jgi:transposase